MIRIGAFVFLLLAASCSSYSVKNNFYSGLEPYSASSEIEGYVIADGGYYMLMNSRNEDGLCIGLLPNDSQKELLRTLNKSLVLVRGEYDPEGCGGDYICHDTCGPDAVVRISEIRRKN